MNTEELKIPEPKGPQPMPRAHLLLANLKKNRLRNKICPCGSGIKYKYCCLRKLQGKTVLVEDIHKIHGLWQAKFLKKMGVRVEPTNRTSKGGHGDPTLRPDRKARD